jgi:hypothetical protein
VRVTRARPALRGPRWVVWVDGNRRFHVSRQKTVEPDIPQKAGATYTGRTSQGSRCFVRDYDEPCTVRTTVARDGEEARVDIYWYTSCDLSGTTFEHMTIRKGRFSSSGPYDEPFDNGQGTSTVDATLHGRFMRTGAYRVRGTLSVTADVTAGDGTHTRCHSGRITFLARP